VKLIVGEYGRDFSDQMATRAVTRTLKQTQPPLRA
jgi:hypothetical protein